MIPGLPFIEDLGEYIGFVLWLLFHGFCFSSEGLPGYGYGHTVRLYNLRILRVSFYLLI